MNTRTEESGSLRRERSAPDGLGSIPRTSALLSALDPDLHQRSVLAVTATHREGMHTPIQNQKLPPLTQRQGLMNHADLGHLKP